MEPSVMPTAYKICMNSNGSMMFVFVFMDEEEEESHDDRQ